MGSHNTIIRAVLLLIIRSDQKRTVLDDLDDLYGHVRSEYGPLYSRCRYLYHVFLTILSFTRHSLYWSVVMFKNYLKTAIRNIFRNPGFSLINISGLAVGIACCIFMLLWVQDEFSFENSHKNRDHLYRVIFKKNKSGSRVTDARGANALGPALMEEYPEIVNFVRFRHGFTGWQAQYKDKSFLNDRMCTADPSFF